MLMKYDMITILGPTASGKTSLAAALAACLKTEIISGDSRQVYRRMDLGTGKDLDDYQVEGYHVPFHLIDIVEPGYKYNVFEYQRDFLQAYQDMRKRGLLPILCGGTGMYLESVLKGYRLLPVPENPEPPSYPLNTWQKWNAAETILLNVYRGYTQFVDSIRRSGEAFSGDQIGVI